MTPKHSTLGPSSAERWVMCPGSVAAVALAPTQPRSRAAAEGTVAHDLGEQLATGRISARELGRKLGRIQKQDGFEIQITGEMADAIAIYANIIKTDAKSLREGYLDEEIFAEAEMKVVVKSISPELFGTADYVTAIPGRVLRVYDFKYGSKTVNPEENKQLAIYALGVIDHFPQYAWLRADIELVIIQPRAGGKAVRRWMVPAGWIKGFHEELIQAVLDTKRPNAPLRPGAWCWWCAAKPTCPAQYLEKLKKAGDDFPDIVA